jgi:hypothetical protein
VELTVLYRLCYCFVELTVCKVCVTILWNRLYRLCYCFVELTVPFVLLFCGTDCLNSTVLISSLDAEFVINLTSFYCCLVCWVLCVCVSVCVCGCVCLCVFLCVLCVYVEGVAFL